MKRSAAEEIVVEGLIHGYAEAVHESTPVDREWQPVVSRPPRHERRRGERLTRMAADVVVTVEQEQVGVVDLSAGGIQFRTKTRLTPGSTVMLRVRWRGDQYVSLALGRVMWATFEKPSTLSAADYRIGVLFEQFDIPKFKEVARRYGGTPPHTLVTAGQHRW